MSGKKRNFAKMVENFTFQSDKARMLCPDVFFLAVKIHKISGSDIVREI